MLVRWEQQSFKFDSKRKWWQCRISKVVFSFLKPNFTPWIKGLTKSECVKGSPLSRVNSKNLTNIWQPYLGINSARWDVSQYYSIIGSRIQSFDWYWKWWPSDFVNGSTFWLHFIVCFTSSWFGKAPPVPFAICWPWPVWKWLLCMTRCVEMMDTWWLLYAGISMDQLTAVTMQSNAGGIRSLPNTSSSAQICSARWR